jgi:hypothetical protein
MAQAPRSLLGATGLRRRHLRPADEPRSADVIDVKFLYDPKKGEYVYYLPNDLTDAARSSISAKLVEYGRRKHLRLRQGV